MKRLATFAIFALLCVTKLVPAPMASAQSGEDICAAAIARQGEFSRYAVVSGSGGTGSQVVVGR